MFHHFHNDFHPKSQGSIDRKQFEKPIVQGVQVVKYLIEKATIKRYLKTSSSISIIFKNPIFINEKIFFEIKKDKKNILLVGKNSFQEKIILKFDFEESNDTKKKLFNSLEIIRRLIFLTKNNSIIC